MTFAASNENPICREQNPFNQNPIRTRQNQNPSATVGAAARSNRDTRKIT